MKIWILYFLIAISSMQALPLRAQVVNFNHIPFKPENVFEGFSDILQDSRGYIWLAGRSNGIYRYDGSDFVNYLHSDSDVTSLGSSNVIRLAIDSSGFMWIGTGAKGLDRYDPVRNSFAHFRHDQKNKYSLVNDTMTAIFIDKLNNLWVGTNGGLDRFDRKTGTFKHYQHNDGDPSSISFNHIRSIYEDHQGVIWIATGFPFVWYHERPEDGGLNRYNISTDNFTRYVHDPSDSNSLETNKVKGLYEDSKGNFWVGTSGDGLHIMDRTKGTFTHYHYDPKNPERLSRPAPAPGMDDYITFINEDVGGRLWIGSSESGINIFDPLTKKINHYGGSGGNYDGTDAKKDTASGFSEVAPYQALFSKDGVVWLVTLNSVYGNYLYNARPFKKSIPYYHVNSHGSNTFYYDADSLLWIGTDSGLIKQNWKLKTETIFINNPKNKNSLSSKKISAIRIDKEKNLWIGTDSGLNKLNTKTQTFTNFRYNPKLNTSLNNDAVWSLGWDHNGNLWIGTTNGLNKMDTRTGKFSRYTLNSKTDSNNYVNCIWEDQDQKLWIGADRGLYYVNLNNEKVTTVFKETLVRGICVDKDNTVWIAADTSGMNQRILYQFDRTRNQLIAFKDPETDKIIRATIDITADRENNLWVTTGDAILKINSRRNRVTNYGQAYGVHRNISNYSDDYISESGLLFFGDANGYYSFSPGDLKDDPLPKLNFTSFKLNGTEVLPSQDGILKDAIWKTNEIHLNFNQNIFSFDFKGISYQSTGYVAYLFKLENYDNDWKKFGSGRVANYFDIPPGNYVFHVKAVNEDGNWIEKKITVIISPPWWKTWWAYTLFGLLFLTSLWSFINYRSKQLRRENQVLEEKVTQRTSQLNKSLEDLKSTQNQLIQSEKMASLGELTAGIAHEIQNPLNFVNNFADVNNELIDELQEQIRQRNFEDVETIARDIKENEKKIIHHGKRADAIVKGMLLHSRSETGNREFTDLNALADEYLRLCYHGIRARDKLMNVSLETDLDPSIGKIALIPLDIGRVLLNMFNNAFYSATEKKKQQGAEYDPIVSLMTKKVNNNVVITIKDNGTGIPKKILEKILQPFFTTKPPGSGTGLGLSLSYDIIKSHGGELNIESVEGEGATFIISLPIS